MNTAVIMLKKDSREFVRDNRLVVMAIVMVVLSLTALLTSYARLTDYEIDRQATEQRERHTWENQGERNPHGAAHFSQWALRPLTPMAVLEPGISDYAGAAVWMEAHHRNGAQGRANDDNPLAFEVGNLSIGWLLQTLLPLFLLIVAAGTVARERELGTLKQLLATGASVAALLRGKLVSLFALVAALAVPVLLAGAMAAVSAGPVDPVRLMLWAAVHLVYLATVVALGLAISTLCRTAASALLLLVALWSASVLFIPRAATVAAETLAPATPPEAFWGAMDAHLKQQPNPFSDEDFKAGVLAQYDVEEIASLPVSFPALQLEESERLGNVVFDRHFAALEAQHDRQRSLLRWASLLSPLPALQNISMALAGTDSAGQRSFQQQAEAHRRKTITMLNRDMAENAVGLDFDYTADSELWQRIPAFQFEAMPLGSVLKNSVVDMLLLLAWAAASALLLLFARRRITASVF